MFKVIKDCYGSYKNLALGYDPDIQEHVKWPAKPG